MRHPPKKIVYPIRGHYTNGASPQPDEHVMILSNLRRDSAWGKAHHCGTQSRVNRDHTSAPDTGTSPIQGNRRLAHRARLRRIQIPPKSHLAMTRRTILYHPRAQNLTHLHQVLAFKISSGCRRQGNRNKGLAQFCPRLWIPCRGTPPPVGRSLWSRLGQRCRRGAIRGTDSDQLVPTAYCRLPTAYCTIRAVHAKTRDRWQLEDVQDHR